MKNFSSLGSNPRSLIQEGDECSQTGVPQPGIPVLASNHSFSIWFLIYIVNTHLTLALINSFGIPYSFYSNILRALID